MPAKSVEKAVAMLIGASLLIGCTSSGWQSTTRSTDACVRRAKLALRDADFDQNGSVVVDDDGGTLVAEHGSYRAKLRCNAGKIEFAVTGPDGGQADWYRDTIVRKFQ